jgi:hypothetical protein
VSVKKSAPKAAELIPPSYSLNQRGGHPVNGSFRCGPITVPQIFSEIIFVNLNEFISYCEI